MKTVARIKAASFRHQGWSIKDIARAVDASQSTVSRWCADISLSAGQKKKLEEKRREAGMKALAPYIHRNQRLKNQDLKIQAERGKLDISKMTQRDLSMLGLGLYWGEGYKRGSQELGFTNSDPEMIRVILAWLFRSYDVSTERIIARITINERYRDQTERLTKEWSRETCIPLSQFGKPSFIQGYTGLKADERTARTYRGTLRIKVRRGTSLRRRILASIAEVTRQINSNSRKTAS